MSDADERAQRAQAREVQNSLVHVMQQNAQAQAQARQDEKNKAKERGLRDVVVQINLFIIDKLEGAGDAGGYKSWEEDVDSLLFAVDLEEVMVASKKDPVEKVEDAYSTLPFPPTTDLQMLADCESVALIARTHTSDELLSIRESTGHRNFQDISRVYGIPLPKKLPWCRHCVENKAERYPRGKSRGTLEASRAG